MEVDEIEKYYVHFDRLVDPFPVAETALEDVDINSEFENFLSKELDNFYSTIDKLKETIDNVVAAKKRFVKNDFADKIISFIYSSLIRFAETDKVKGISYLKHFSDDLNEIMKNRTRIHFFHILGEIIGYVHSYCNYKLRESKTKISVVAHSLFRFDFFLLKGLRAGFWKTRDISIVGKNPTNINFTK